MKSTLPEYARPVVLLDVDGVLNVFSRDVPRVWRAMGVERFAIRNVHTPTMEDRPGPWLIKFIPAVIDWINSKQDEYQFIWLTSWGNAADQHLAPEIGLNGHFMNGFTIADVEPAYNGAQTIFRSKIAAVSTLLLGSPLPSMASEDAPGVLAGRKVVWIDDEIDRNARDAFRGYGLPLLPLRTYETVGITPEMIAQVEAFFAE